MLTIVWENGNGTFRFLSNNVDKAIKEALEQYDIGWTSGRVSLCESTVNGPTVVVVTRKACRECGRDKFESELAIFAKLAKDYMAIKNPDTRIGEMPEWHSEYNGA